jgi:hypothetical protein
LSSAKEAEKRWRSSSVERIAGRHFSTTVGEGRNLVREAEESPLLEAVPREWVITTEQVGKG